MKQLIEMRNAKGVEITLPRRFYCSRKKGGRGGGVWAFDPSFKVIFKSNINTPRPFAYCTYLWTGFTYMVLTVIGRGGQSYFKK
jgi:hypothetical protein